MAKTKETKNISILNKRGLHDNTVLEKFVAGISLTGNEVKAVKSGAASLQDSFVHIRNGEAFLENVYISPYQSPKEAENRRSRKLLLKKAEIDYLLGKSQASSLTVIPIKLYNTHGLIKVEIALVQGKKLFDKRRALKEKAIQREVEQEVRGDKLKHQQKLGN